MTAGNDTLALVTTTWRGQPAWQVTGRSLRLTITEIGAHLAALQTTGDDLNPLWQPAWDAADPRTVQPDAASPYGDGIECDLLAGIVGHNLCLDRFGPPWPGEKRPVHGEAGVVPWTATLTDDASALHLRTTLPLAELGIERVVRLLNDAVQVTTTVTNQGSEPKDIEWAEHVSIGDPFLDGAIVAAGVDQAVNGPDPIDDACRFPDAGPLGPVPVLDALAVPASNEPRALGDIMTARVTEGWFRFTRPDIGWTLSYHWQADEFPWLCLWTQHRSRTGAPWNGQVRARGMEFATKPFPEGLPPEERSREFLGRPTALEIQPGEPLTRTFHIYWRRL